MSHSDCSSSHSICHIPNISDGELGEKQLLGAGGFGKVFKRKWTKDGNPRYVAEKILIQSISNPNDQSALKREAEILWTLHHPNIIELYGLHCSDDRFSIIMAYCEFRSAFHFFKNLKNEKENWPIKMRISFQVSNAMHYLHSLPTPMLHLDLKADNVLLDSQLNVKLCDFGLAEMKTLSRITQQIPGTPKTPKPCCGTISHIAPEHLQSINSKRSTKSDVYSYGIFLWELLAQIPAYADSFNSEILMKQIIDGGRPDSTIDGPNVIRKIMVQAWDRHKERRPTFDEIQNTLKKNQNRKEDISLCVVRVITLYRKMSGAVNSTIGCSNVHQIPNYVNGNYYSDDVQPKTRSSMLVDRRAFTSDRDAETNPKQVFLPPVYSNTLASSSNFVDNADGLYNDTAALITNSSDSGTSYEVSSPKCTNRTKIMFTIIIVVLLLLSTAAVLLKIFLFNTVDCSAPSSDPNGSLSCSSGSGKYPSGSTCALTCKEGFGVRTGAVKSTCEHGTWSGGLGKCLKLGICSSLPLPANNGFISCTNKFYEMSNCSFSCPSGYRLRGNGIVTSSMCEIIGGDITKTKWSNPEPYCEKVTTCPPLPKTTTVNFVCTNTQTSNGTVCTALCSHGFAVKGNPSVKCEINGQWNTTVLPYCQTVCPLPEYLAGGSYTCTQARFVTSVCTFTCKPNFTLVGPVRTTCMPKGDWTSRVPTCMCPSCRAGTDCEVERTWNSTMVQLTQALSKPNTKFHYGVETIMCVSKPQSNSTYSCYCKDIPTNRMKQCNNYPDKLTACTRSLASLILMMSFDGGYVIPCDAEYMPPSCL